MILDLASEYFYTIYDIMLRITDTILHFIYAIKRSD